jgi:antitoxin component of MazEF toxin-antitoxin module
MVKKLVRHGNSLALVLDKPVLDLLKIDEETALEISTEDGKTLQIRPVDSGERSAKLEAALKKVNRRYGKTLKNLAK